ncbi:MAG: signal peptidase I [Mogibacterium sp.]|nr:signal peptidase I [Mogibacterium sp.]
MKAIAKVFDIIGTVTILLVFVLCLSLAVPKLLGFQTYAVMSGSMEPNIPVGSVIYAGDVDPATLGEGDVIVFYNGKSDVPITHRVVRNDTDKAEVITKGDANQKEDAPIPYENVIGVVKVHIPYLGHIFAVMSTVSGKLALVAVALAGTLFCVLSKILDR